MRTPEPFGSIGVTDPDRLRFVVQRHLASRAHFDLRLEWDGVLRSWAVPEGPSLDPKDKRFAIATEDHPLDYLDFEGVIPEGGYGAGTLWTWDRGLWVPLDDPGAGFDAGEVKFRLDGTRLGGGWMLKRLPKAEREWLLIKERDPAVVAGYRIPEERPKRKRAPKPIGTPAALPKRVRPQLPSSVDSPPVGQEWLHEIKFDGYRTLAHKDGTAVKFLTRQGLDWTARYAALGPVVADLDCETALIDGEIAVQDARGATSFEMLQVALSEGRDRDLIYYVFDLIHLNGRDLSAESLTARKALLRRLIPAEAESRLQYSDHATGDGRQLFAQACRLGLEGVVSKRADAAYRQGRTTSWVKAKRFDVAIFDVIGFTTKASSRHVASLILAEDGGTPAYVGRAGTGLSLDETRALFEAFSALEIDTPPIAVPKTPNAHFIAPGQYSAEISFRGRTTKNLIRQAAILNVRAAAPAPERRVARLITDRDLAAIQLTNPEREIFEGSGTTKLDIALYYARVGEWMLPHLLDRPVTLIRCTTGKVADCFYQRHGFSGLPDGVETMGTDRDEEYLVIRSARGFLGLPQFGVIEFHPWDCTVADLDHPDRMTVDLDPGEDVDWATIVSAAGMVRDRLTDLGLTGFVRTTGGAGVHLVVPLAGTDDWAAVRAFLKGLARQLAQDLPRLFTDQVSKARRVGRIYVDINRTTYGTSAVASYSLRADPAFPVAMPLLWSELNAATLPSEFLRKNAPVRLEKASADAWADFEDARAALTGQAQRAVGQER